MFGSMSIVMFFLPVSLSLHQSTCYPCIHLFLSISLPICVCGRNTTCACRCRSAGYLWLIIAVGPVALTIDLIKADKTWPFKRTTHASQ